MTGKARQYLGSTIVDARRCLLALRAFSFGPSKGSSGVHRVSTSLATRFPREPGVMILPQLDKGPTSARILSQLSTLGAGMNYYCD